MLKGWSLAVVMHITSVTMSLFSHQLGDCTTTPSAADCCHNKRTATRASKRAHIVVLKTEAEEKEPLHAFHLS
jgi:hypothetical protein